MIKNYFSYSLAKGSKELSPSQFYLSSEFTIHFGNDESGFREKGTFLYPPTVKKASEKKQLVFDVIDSLEAKRQQKNKYQREYRKKKTPRKSKKKIPLIEQNLEQVKRLSKRDQVLWAMQKYFPSQYELLMSKPKDFDPKAFRITSISFPNDMVEIRVKRNLESFTVKSENDPLALKVFQIYLFFNKEVEVTPETEEAEDQINEILDYSRRLITPIWNIKGENRFIYKLFTPQYDNDGKLFLGEENKYSMGFSQARTTEQKLKSSLEKMFRATLDKFYGDGLASAKTYLARKFMSRITVNGAMVEKVIDTIPQ